MENYLKKELYDRLKKDDTLFDFIQEAALDGLWYWDLENPAEEWMNSRFWEVLGYDPKEMPHKSNAWQDIIFPEDLELAKENLEKHVQNPIHPYDQVVRYKHKNGSTVWIRCKGQAQFNDQGKAIRMLGAHVELTELKEAELALKESNEKFRSYINSAPDAIFVVNEQGRYLDVNFAASKMTGYSHEELLQMTTKQLIHPGCLEVGRNHFIEMIKNGYASAEFDILNKTGETIMCSIEGVKIHDDLFLGFLKDITRRKKAEKELKDSEARYKALHNASFGGIVIHDKGVILDCNYGISTLTGFSREELMGEIGVELLIAPESRNTVMQKILSGFEDEYEVLARKKHGGKFEARIQSKNIPYKGKVVQVTEFRDISQQKQAERALFESEKKFKAFYDTNPSATFVWKYVNNDFELIDVNASANKISANKAAAFIGNSVRELYREMPEMTERFYECYKTRKPLEFEILYQSRSHKKSAWTKFRMAFLEPDIILLFADLIHERKTAEENLKRSEANLQAVFNNTLQLFIMIGADYKIITLNKIAKEYYQKVLNRAVGAGDNVLELVYHEHKETFKQNFTKALSGQTIVVERSMPHKGSEIYFNFHYNPVFNHDGTVSKVVFSVLDITGQKHAEKSLIEAKNKAEESDRLKSAFLANMSHEIRTPMNAILGFSDLLMKPDLNDERKEKYIEQINAGGKRLLALISDIVDISKIDAGQLKTQMEVFNLNDVLRLIYMQFMVYPIQKNVKLTYECELSDNKSHIFMEKSRLIQILTNLIENALKFTSKGEVCFGYHIKNNKIQFFVKDTGIGISETHQKIIFERFRQIDNEYSKGGSGTGLGLSIVKGLVDLLKGEVSIESSVGKGSSFNIYLPYHPRENPEASEKSVDSLRNEGEKVTVLIAEDEESNYLFLKELLQGYHCKIILAKNGKVAVKKFIKKSQDIDIVLMDIKMPVMDGFEAFKRIREINKHVPIVAQTAYAMNENKDEALAFGFNDFITKPIIEEELLKTLQRFTAFKLI